MSDTPVLKIQLMLKGRPIKSYTFIKDVVTIGRDPGSDVVLDNMGVSRHHARITCEAGRCIIEDAGSSNGTFVNGARVQRHELLDADRIKIGKFDLHLGIGAHSASTDEVFRERVAVDEDGTTVLTTDQLARVLKGQEQPADTQPALALVEGTRNSRPRAVGSSSRVLWVLALIGALLVGIALGAALF